MSALPFFNAVNSGVQPSACRLLTSAPCLSRSRAIDFRPVVTAVCSGVSPLCCAVPISASLSSSNSTTSAKPPATAACSAVLSAPSLAFTSALFAIRYRAIAVRPCCEAPLSGVLPSGLRTFTSAPCFTRYSTTNCWLLSAAAYSSERSSPSPHVRSRSCCSATTALILSRSPPCAASRASEADQAREAQTASPKATDRRASDFIIRFSRCSPMTNDTSLRLAGQENAQAPDRMPSTAGICCLIAPW